MRAVAVVLQFDLVPETQLASETRVWSEGRQRVTGVRGVTWVTRVRVTRVIGVRVTRVTRVRVQRVIGVRVQSKGIQSPCPEKLRRQRQCRATGLSARTSGAVWS